MYALSCWGLLVCLNSTHHHTSLRPMDQFLLNYSRALSSETFGYNNKDFFSCSLIGSFAQLCVCVLVHSLVRLSNARSGGDMDSLHRRSGQRNERRELKERERASAENSDRQKLQPAMRRFDADLHRH